MKQKNKDKRKKRLLTFLLPVVIGICVIGACYLFAVFSAVSMLQNQCDPSEPSEFESLAQVSLPSSYDSFHSVCFGMQGWGAEAKFDINPDELDLFLETTNIEQPLSSTNLPTASYSAYLEIDLDTLESFLYARHQANEWFEEIIVDTSNPNRWTIYFTVLGG